MRSNPKSSFPQTTAQFNLSLNFEVNLNADSVGTPRSCVNETRKSKTTSVFQQVRVLILMKNGKSAGIQVLLRTD